MLKKGTGKASGRDKILRGTEDLLLPLMFHLIKILDLFNHLMCIFNERLFGLIKCVKKFHSKNFSMVFFITRTIKVTANDLRSLRLRSK